MDLQERDGQFCGRKDIIGKELRAATRRHYSKSTQAQLCVGKQYRIVLTEPDWKAIGDVAGMYGMSPSKFIRSVLNSFMPNHQDLGPNGV